MRQGRVFKRCSRSGCGAKVPDKCCPRCGGDKWSWAYVVDVNPSGAKRKQVRRGGFATKKEALAALQELQVDTHRQGYMEPSRMTVADYVALWLPAYKARVRPGTYAAAESHVRVHIVPHIGDHPLRSLDRGTVKALYGRLGETLSRKTVWNVHLTLHAALEDAAADGLIRLNPAAKACHAPEQNSPACWTADELAVFLVAARSHRLFAFYRTAANTGSRRGELVGLRWRHLDLDAATMTVVESRVKAKVGVQSTGVKSARSQRTVDLDAETVRMLREHRGAYLAERLALGLGAPGPDDLVFVAEDHRPLHPDVVSQTFERLVTRLRTHCVSCGKKVSGGHCRQCNADHRPPRHITLHGLRHTHATLSLAAGVPLHIVSRRLGHANEAFTARQYAHVLPQQGADAAARFAALIDGEG